MSTKGLIGNVHAKFSADTQDFKQNLKGAADSIRKVASAAKSTGDAVVAASSKMERASLAQRHAHDRALRAFQREQQAQVLAEARASQLAAANKELARAQDLAALKADILARAEENVGLSSIKAVRGLQLMARTAKEKLGETGNQIAEVAERAELSADGIASAFGGIGALLGGGFAVAFAAHALDDIAELNVELGDLHEKTGIAVKDLAGLRLIAQSKGLDFSTISMGLTRLGKAMYEAKLGMLEDREAFSSLGISMKEVDTDSVEQMFYRVSRAIGENRSLVLSDGTALELFGRGGKELIPVLQEYGGSLQSAVKDQAAMTGITDESVQASQRWLKVTSDLSAEMHANLIPVLEEIVKLVPYIRVGFDLLGIGAEKTLGTVISYALSAVSILHGMGTMLNDLGNKNVGMLVVDWKQMNNDSLGAKAWKAEDAAINKNAMDAALAWNSRNDPLGESETGQNRPAAVDGVMMRNAKQQLAAMEQKHTLTRDQIIGFWRGKLAQARPGSADYEQINLLLGNLMQKAGTSANAAAQSLGMQKLRDSAIGLSPSDAYSYWSSRSALFPPGTKEREQITAEATKAWVAVQRAQVAMRAEAVKNNLMFTPFVDMHGNPQPFSPNVDMSRFDLTRSKEAMRSLEGPTLQATRMIEAQNKMRAAVQEANDAIMEQSIRAAAEQGHITKLDAAVSIAALHQRQYSEAMAPFQQQIESISSGVGGLGMTPLEKRRAIADVEAQRAAYSTGAMRVAQQDAYATGQWKPGSTMVAVRNALDDFVLSVRDASGAVRGLVASALEGTNETLSRALMSHAYTGWQYRRNIVNALGGEVRGLGAQGLNAVMAHTEGSVLAHFGFGPKAKRGESAAAPLFVSVVNGASGAAGGIGSVAAGLTSMIGSSGPAGAMAGVLGGALKALPVAFQGFFANGGTVLPGAAAMVGEMGPELFVPRTPGTIVPHHQIQRAFAAGAGGDTHIHIDARGSHDPAATEAAVHRGMAASLSMTPRIALQAVSDYRKRVPTSKQRA
jgi:hypothetical protein